MTSDDGDFYKPHWRSPAQNLRRQAAQYHDSAASLRKNAAEYESRAEQFRRWAADATVFGDAIERSARVVEAAEAAEAADHIVRNTSNQGD